MQPYQQSSEEIRRQGEFPIQALKTAGSLGATAGSAIVGGTALNRVLPFLSKYVPENLAVKGLEKIDPRFGKFINKALAAGKSFDEVKDFIAEKAETSKPQENIIANYSPKLDSFIQKHLKNGRTIDEAGALAQVDSSFKKDISKIEKDLKTNFSDILSQSYGRQQVEKTANPRGNNQPQQGQQAQMPSDNSDQALMAALEKILSM